MSEPRWNQQAEQAVIGALLQDRRGEIADAITATITDPGDFYQPRHGTLYSRIVAMREERLAVDALMLLNSIPVADLQRLGGADYIQACMAAAPLIEHGPAYARTVRGLARLRELALHATRTSQWVAAATPDEAEALLDRVQDDAAQLAAGAVTDTPGGWDELLDAGMAGMARIQEQALSGVLPGVPTGWSDLDKLLNNLQGGQLVIAAARPGVGKSVFGRNIAQHSAMRRQLPSLFLSLEMSQQECVYAFVAAGARVPLHAIRAGQLDDGHWQRIINYQEITKGSPLTVVDGPSTLARARAVLRQQIRAGSRPGLLVWDYLQITDVPGYDNRNRQEAVSALSRGFKLLAQEYDIPVLVLSQLNRGPELRADKRPGLADLRESGSLEQDADVVILLHRDDYYDPETPRAGEIDLIVAKNRHGGTDTVTLASQLHYQRYTDMALAA